MEISKPEVAAVEQAVVESEKSLRVLDELQLSVIGGGMGDVVFV